MPLPLPLPLPAVHSPFPLQSMTRSRALHKLLCDFQEAATAGAVAISDVRRVSRPYVLSPAGCKGALSLRFFLFFAFLFILCSSFYYLLFAFLFILCLSVYSLRFFLFVAFLLILCAEVLEVSFTRGFRSGVLYSCGIFQ